MTETFTPVDLTNSETPKDQGADSKSIMNEYQNPSPWKAQKALLRQALPIILMLVTSILVQNLYEIFLFLALVIAFDSVNSFVVKQSELPRGVSVLKILAVLFYLAVCLCLSYPAVESFWLFHLVDWTGWFFSGEHLFWETLYHVVVADFLCKYSTMFLKCLILLMSKRVIPVHKRGRIFMACEGVSQVARCLLPIPQWSRYIIMADMCPYRILCLILVSAYVILKLKSTKEKLNIIASPCKHNTVTGVKLQPISSGDIPDEEKLCAICHLSHSNPVRLPCLHMYCHDCISLWFDREQHCPQCASTSINSLVLGLQSVLAPVAQYTSSNSKWKTGTTDYVIQMF